MRKIISLVYIAGMLLCAGVVSAEEIVQDKVEILRAKVVDVVKSEQDGFPGTDITFTTQTIEVRITSGDRKGEVVSIINDYVIVKEGDRVFLNHTVGAVDSIETYSLYDVSRGWTLIFFVALFIGVVFLFGGKQGLRGLLSLLGSLLVIFFVLIPGILRGVDPVFLSIVAASIIIVLGSYVTHGFNRTTSAAVIGMILTVVIAGFLAKVAVFMTKLTGFVEEEAMYLNFSTSGAIDFQGLLLGAILIGLLGTLYDAAISQAIAVEEIHHTDPTLSKKRVYTKVLRIGREHIGALVDTLAIAYVGAALPLLLLYSLSEVPFGIIINREVFATEIIRITVGSIGVILAVPITTYISTHMLVGKLKKRSHEHGHSHVHSHMHTEE